MHSPAKWRCCEVCDVVSAFHFNYSMKARLRYSIGLFSMLCMGWSWNSTHFVSLCIQTINSPTTTEHRTTEKNSRKWIDGWFLILQPCKNYSYQLWKYRHILFQLSHTHTPTHTQSKEKKTITFQNGRTHSNDSISHIFFSTFSFRACFSYFISYNSMLCYLWGDLTLHRTPYHALLK